MRTFAFNFGVRSLTVAALLACVQLCAGEGADALAASKKAIAYLSSAQNADGTFGKGREAAMPGVAGLVVHSLVLSPDKLTEENSPVVKKGVAFLFANQQESGSFAAPKFGLENYNTAFAIMAIAPLQNPAYREKLAKAKDFLIGAQFLEKKEDAAYGSFGYAPKQPGDLSNTSYVMDALTALAVPTTDNVWKNALIFVRRCQDNSETNDIVAMKAGPSSGGFVYKPSNSATVERNGKSEKFVPKAYGSMSYEGFRLLLQTTKYNPNDPALQAARKWIANNFSVMIHPGVAASNEKHDDKSGYFYYVYGLAKALAENGQNELTLADGKKVRWAAELSKHLISIQKPDGSFVNTSSAWMENSPVLATAFALGALNECVKNLK